MPVHPAEETTGGSKSFPPHRRHQPYFIHTANLIPGITDKVAKESSDSNASTHQIHDEDHSGISSGGNVAANAHKANPVRAASGWLAGLRWGLTTRQGPVHADNLPEPASKEELKKRAEELNK